MNTPPTIRIGIADPESMLTILPFASSDGDVYPDAKGRVRFRARVEDANANLVALTITGPNTSASMMMSPSGWGIIGTSWDVRRVASGREATVTVTATDNAGGSSSKSVRVRLRKA